MKTKPKKRRLKSKKNDLFRGSAVNGALYLIILLFLVGSIAYMLIGGQLPASRQVFKGPQVAIISPSSEPAQNNLQLHTFIGLTVTPTPTPAPTVAPSQQPSLCQSGGVNSESEILVGYSPANGQTVGVGGQIKVWVNDEGAPIIAPNEQVDPNTGQITAPGDRTAAAPDGYLWEPALYISPQTAENGGTPHFPNYIKGDYSNTTNPGGIFFLKGPGSHSNGMEPVPPGSQLSEQFTAEDIWDVNSLALAPGTYTAEFVIHDGDEDRGIGCVSITIQ